MSFYLFGGGGGDPAAETVDLIAGEAIAAGQLVYQAHGAVGTQGRVYLTDRDLQYASNKAAIIGVATNGVEAAGATVTVQYTGVATVSSTLVADKVYSPSSTPGELAANGEEPMIGVAESTSELRLTGVVSGLSGLTSGVAYGSNGSGVLTAGQNESIGYAISSTELLIRSEYGATKPSSSPWVGATPLHLWQLDDGSGATLANTGSGSGNATLGGDYQWITGETIGSSTFTCIQTHNTGSDPASASGAQATIASVGAASYTYAVWVKAADLDDNFRTMARGSRAWNLQSGGGGLNDRPNYYTGGGYKASTSNIPLNTWCHIAFVQDGSGGAGNYTLKFYFNATEQGSHSSFTGDTWSATGFNLLRTSSGGSAFYGRAYQFAAWNSALTAAEITTIYNSGTPIDLV